MALLRAFWVEIMLNGKMAKKPRILVIVGPTASGKSSLAVKLAKRLNGEVISADSRQAYKGLDIGTGKVTRSEMQGIPHHLLNVADPRKQFTAHEYSRMANDTITMINTSGKLPIIVGGSGFYIDALTMSLPAVPPDLKLRKSLQQKSVSELQKMLGKHKIKDPENKVRLIRAIEIIETLGKIPKLKIRNDYDFVWIGLKPKDLEKKIEKRLHARIPGMLREARRLHARGLSWKRMEELGLEYRYLARLLQKKIARDEFEKELYAEIRRYAKRQMTWFKRNKAIEWFDSPESAFRATIQALRVSKKLRSRGR
jgi:tRNA dimethylallyltransferase